MKKNLAIKGHPTRGKEVIELLKMMGARNEYNILGKDPSCIYFIDGYEFIRIEIIENNIHTMRHWQIFTLEEFLEKFPFKIHDLVNIPEYESEVDICGMRWDSLSKCVEYMVYRNDDEEWYTAEELLEWNDNPNNTSKHMEEKKINQMSLANCDLDEVEIVLGDKFELKTKDGKYYAVRKKSKYPTTYKECCEVIGISRYDIEIDIPQPYQQKMSNLFKLIICRDAYWKIAGEEMGLDGPWEHNYLKDVNIIRYAIYNTEDEIVKLDGKLYRNYILCFPTIEMRDAFYENFKDLIESCKELL